MTDVAIAKPAEGSDEAKTLMDLKTNECKFPVAERGGQHLFCGKRRMDANTHYCSKHFRVMYAEKKPRPIVAPIQR